GSGRRTAGTDARGRGISAVMSSKTLLVLFAVAVFARTVRADDAKLRQAEAQIKKSMSDEAHATRDLANAQHSAAKAHKDWAAANTAIQKAYQQRAAAKKDEKQAE